jgi:hypothetical protein
MVNNIACIRKKRKVHLLFYKKVIGLNSYAAYVYKSKRKTDFDKTAKKMFR